jgi:hypothetical protein
MKGRYTILIILTALFVSNLSIAQKQRSRNAVVYVKFDIDKNGSTSNPKILRVGRVYYDEFDRRITERLTRDVWAKEVDYGYCKNEAFRLIRLLKFTPARRNSTAVYFRGYVLPLHVIYPVGSGD